ncbi:putative PKS/NRPS-like protein biosynthetic cluster, partial [Arthromyces matolae]
MGIGRGDAEEAIATFTKESPTALYITAVMDDTCVTISGRPDILSDFSTFLSAKASIVIHKTGLDTLYHSSVHAKSTRNQVLHDVASQNIRFPQYSDLKAPIRSTMTGRPITKNDVSGSLVELVIDMLLIHPVNWNLVVDDIARNLPKDRCIELLNVGPGLGLARSIERTLPAGAASIVDVSSTTMHSPRQPPPKQEPIAIIGMAVNMPGAPNVSKLWEVLEQGINTISEIPGHRFHISDYKDGKASGRKMRAHTGNFISGADEFDNKFFKISPREAKSMDPQQRILLHTAYEALEDSGYVPNSTPTSRPDNFGCYIGVATHDYIQNLRDDIDVYYSPGGNLESLVAMLNNFGAAGSNSAVLVEEYLRPQTAPSPPGMYLVFGLSAKDSSALELLRSKYLHFLQNCGADTLADVAYSMTARRQIYDHRISIFANSKDALIRKLQRALPAQVNAKSGSTVFVFSGQGGQYVGMGRSLYHTSVLFRSHIDECHEILKRDGFPGVLDILTAETQTSGLSELEEFEAYQASIFALQYALAKLWISWGISPAAVVGHSLGEYAALVISGVLSLEDALCVVAHRVRLMVQRCAVNETGMIAVNLGAVAVQDILHASPEFSSLSIACYNSPSDSVLSGPLETLKSFKEHLDDNVHCKNILLSVPFGYHSHAMAPLLNDLKAIARRVSLRPPTIPIVSNVFGDVVRPGDSSIINSDYFARHCAEPVQFEKGIQALMRTFSAAQFDVWIEIGPHSTTLPMLKANPSLPRGSTFLPSLRKQHDSWETLTGSLSQLFLEGVHVRWREVFAHIPNIGCVSLPSYPFSPSKFWVEYKEPRATSELASNLISATSSTGFAMLGRWAQRPSASNNNTAIFETPIEKVGSWICGHSVGGFPLCPASVYTEQALSAIHLTFADLNLSLESSHIVLRKIQFPKPLVYDPTLSHTLFTKITIEDKS